MAEELRKKGNTSDLAREMEVECDLKEAYPEYATISDWELYEKGTHHKLAEHLREAGLKRISTMYVLTWPYYVDCIHAVIPYYVILQATARRCAIII